MIHVFGTDLHFMRFVVYNDRSVISAVTSVFGISVVVILSLGVYRASVGCFETFDRLKSLVCVFGQDSSSGNVFEFRRVTYTFTIHLFRDALSRLQPTRYILSRKLLLEVIYQLVVTGLALRTYCTRFLSRSVIVTGSSEWGLHELLSSTVYLGHLKLSLTLVVPLGTVYFIVYFISAPL